MGRVPPPPPRSRNRRYPALPISLGCTDVPSFVDWFAPMWSIDAKDPCWVNAVFEVAELLGEDRPPVDRLERAHGPRVYMLTPKPSSGGTAVKRPPRPKRPTGRLVAV